ncbi:hypothetical protein J4Q44_G00327810 [Coregonus suidteri]|uniref:PIK-related kinase FAT domain-containing protein n=1 Tax=Coregonus suidteri TaxID=861788 RepID=A0AAN8KWM4_9TELE
MRGLESEGVEWRAELRELRFQAAWRNMQWDCDLSERGSEVEELCRGSLEAVSSLYPALRNLQGISELESVRQLFSKPLTDVGLAEVCSHWQQHSQLLVDSDFGLVEPILALRSVAQETLIYQERDPEKRKYLSTVLTSHLMELCQLHDSEENWVKVLWDDGRGHVPSNLGTKSQVPTSLTRVSMRVRGLGGGPLHSTPLRRNYPSLYKNWALHLPLVALTLYLTAKKNVEEFIHQVHRDHCHQCAPSHIGCWDLAWILLVLQMCAWGAMWRWSLCQPVSVV